MPVSQSDPRRIPSSGPPDARIVILGEAPGKEEDLHHTPFVGWSGNKLFNDILPRAGITREKCLVGNVVPVRPPNNYLHHLYSIGVSLEEEIIECRKWVNEYPRDLVICCGNTALKAITGDDRVSLYRGSLLTNPGGAPRPHHDFPFDVYVMYHPAAIAKDWQLDAICKVDAKKLKQIRDAPSGQFDIPVKDLYLYGQTIHRSLRTRVVAPAQKSAEYFIHFIEDVKRRAQPFTFDIETYNETITVFGLATSSNRAISIPFTGQFSPDEEAALIEAIRDLLDTPIPKITQNGIYDCTLLADAWRVPVRGAIYDTMLMHHCLYSELPHSLAFLTSVYTFEPFFKQMAKEASDATYDLAHWEYNALDCACTYQVWEGLCKELDHAKLWDFYLTHYHPLSYTIANIQRRGIRIDKEKRAEIKAQIEGELLQLQDRINSIVGSQFNVNSPKQMKEYVHGVLNLPKQKSKQTDAESLGESQLHSLARRFPVHSDFLHSVTTIRQKRKLISTYLTELEDPDGRIRTSYNIAGAANKADASGGTETGRLSSSKNHYGRGGNLQNIPKAMREMFIPEPGWTFWQCDMASAETYIVAWESGDEHMLQILTNHPLYKADAPRKIMYHEFIGSIISGLEPSDVVGDLRELAKRVGHGWNYGMAERKMVETINNDMPHMLFGLADARRCILNLNTTLRGVINWRASIRAQLMQGRTISNCFGRKRIFFGRMDENTFREAYAFIPQGTVGDALNKCMIHLEDLWQDHDDVKILGQVHDSIFGIGRDESMEQIQEEVEAEFTKPLPMTCKGIPLRIPCEFKQGKNWKEC